ncbi:hypothetical protein Halru_2631 [Halovivax ruber XH-70]|uniref:Uncharacterized protein n=1 Tax=Halovivax ruber (strain DSM 18193 / JCM 13892 / XH-70) TaxID=797302 RepID=L0IEL4_HALRX|nr:hypothetical protein [Halovivax ruber]AGB17209.1 hypothetical protein Halru_2631 [Halovivax ruber XH-70]
MSTSVKVTDETKSRLEELQAEIRLETGRTVTQQELLERIVTSTHTSKSELVEAFRDEFEGLSEQQIERWLSGTINSGVETREDDIDDIVYGG